jgi:oxygen-independent coproporphyrinogen-3 oxidase
VVRDYIAAADAGEASLVFEEPWTVEAMKRDTVMLGLRLVEGVSSNAFEARFGQPLLDYLEPRAQDLIAAGVLVWRGDALALAPHSYFICNAVLGEILPEAMG